MEQREIQALYAKVELEPNYDVAALRFKPDMENLVRLRDLLHRQIGKRHIWRALTYPYIDVRDINHAFVRNLLAAGQTVDGVGAEDRLESC